MVMTKKDFDDFVHRQVKTFEDCVDKIYTDGLDFHNKGCNVTNEKEKEACAEEFMYTYYKAIARHLKVKTGMPTFSAQKLN